MDVTGAQEHAQGCLVCGVELAYAQVAAPETCAICGIEEPVALATWMNATGATAA